MRELIHASAISKPKANINIFNGVQMKFTYKESSLLILIAMVVKICVSETILCILIVSGNKSEAKFKFYFAFN